MSESNDAPNLCIAPSRHEQPCLRESLPGAPYPLCLEHAVEILRFFNGATEAHAGAAIAAARAIAEMDGCIPPEDNLPGRGTSVVYYVRIGQLIKIGHSNNLRQRLRFYPPDHELLALESGDRLLEGRRLRQFRDTLHARDEWFTPSVELLEHIERLAAA